MVAVERRGTYPGQVMLSNPTSLATSMQAPADAMAGHRLVSCYRDKLRGEVEGYTYFTIRPGVANCLARFDAFIPGMSFADFVVAVASIRDEDADGHLRSQHTFVTDEEGKIGIDFIGRFERLAEDFRFVQERIGLPRNELPWLQKARAAARYTDFYSNETRQIAGDRFRQDIEIFGYEFGVT